MPSNHDRLLAFMRNPPKRIRPETIKRRKKKGLRACPGNRKGEMFKRQKGRCKYCRIPMTWDLSMTGVTVDHIVPLCKGGRNHRDNIVLACRRCNSAKADKTAEEFKTMVDEGLENARVSAGAALRRGWR